MNYELDLSHCERVSFSTLRIYLVEHGWIHRRNTSTSTIYRIVTPSFWDEVAVPNRKTYSDYSQQIYDILKTLSRVEQRPMHDIYSDIILGNKSNAFQYHLFTGDETGTIPLDWIIQILESHKDLSISAYMDIVKPESYHKSVSDGKKALRNMRMGQTEVGSFIIKIYYPDTPSKQKTLGSLPNDEVLHKLSSKIIDSAKTIIDCAVDNTELQPNSNISYNFVDSLLSLKIDSGYDIEMKDIGVNSSINETIELTPNIFSIVEPIADSLKPQAEKEIRNFVGHIYALSELGYSVEDDSKFKIEYFDEEKGTAKATLFLSGSERRIALESIADHNLVSLKGQLSGYGRTKRIEKISDFRIVS